MLKLGIANKYLLILCHKANFFKILVPKDGGNHTLSSGTDNSTSESFVAYALMVISSSHYMSCSGRAK